jgi:HK97 family phage prohead protease
MQKKMSNKETRIFHAGELRANMESRTIRGYAAVFGMSSEDLGGFREVIAPGAFDDILGDDVRALVNHDPSMILARTKSGTLRLFIDERGLGYEFDTPNTTYGNDLLESVSRGDVTQSSFGFTVKEHSWNKEERTRTILKVGRLFDVSPVTYPAYPDTDVAMRSLAEQEQSEESKQTAVKLAHMARAISINLNKMKL